MSNNNTRLIDGIVSARGFCGEFSEEVLTAAARQSRTPTESPRRVDARAVVTIDDDHAHDFGDAVHYSRQEDSVLSGTVFFIKKGYESEINVYNPTNALRSGVCFVNAKSQTAKGRRT